MMGNIHDINLFGEWAATLIEQGGLSLGSAKIYRSMWNKFFNEIPEGQKIIGYSSQGLADVIISAAKDSETSYPKRMSQLVSRVLLHHYPDHLAAIELPSQFSDLRKKDPVYLTKPVVIKETDADEDGWKIIRDKAMAALSVYGGFRLREIIQLQLTHIKSDADGYIIDIKGQRPRLVPIAKTGNPILAAWLSKRADICDQENHPYVFISTASGKQVSRLTVGRAIKRILGGDLGEGDPESHGTSTAARNTFATRQMVNGFNNEEISDWMGYRTSFTLDRHSEALKADKVPIAITGQKKARPIP